MDIIEILASPKNLLKLAKRVSPFRTSVLIRRQVTGDDHRARIRKSCCGIDGISAGRIRDWHGAIRKSPHRGARRHCETEGCASRQVSSGICFCSQRLIQKVRVPVVRVIEVWRAPSSVAAIAVTLSIDNEAAQSNQTALLGVFPFEIQWDRNYRITDLDKLVLLIVSVVLRLYGR